MPHTAHPDPNMLYQKRHMRFEKDLGDVKNEYTDEHERPCWGRLTKGKLKYAKLWMPLNGWG